MSNSLPRFVGTPPYVDPNATNRTSFGNHAWVEITLGGRTSVLDACHALRGVTPLPPAGDLTRPEYLNATLDQAKAHGNAQSKSGTSGSGDCGRKPLEFWLLALC